MNKIPKPLKITLAVLTGLLVIGVIATAGGDKKETNKTESKPAQTEQAKDLSRCLDVPENIVANINEGWDTKGLTFRKAKAVKSKDFESVYFVSGDIQGAGLESESDIATFTTNKLDTVGIYMSVDGVAKEFSVFPDASTTDAKATMSDDGAKLSRDCVNG